MISFKAFLAEGGWSNTATQGTKLTPEVAKKALEQLPRFEKDFNAYLDKLGLPRIEIGKPVGSSAYIDRDIEDHPDKEYGDIDVIFVIPKIDSMSEAKVSAMYSKSVKDFVAEKKPSYILKDDNPGSAIIVKVGPNQWAQVDLVKTPGHLVDWAEKRMTPEHGLKGALLGNLYTSFGDLLNISIGPSGVFAKEKDNEIVPTGTLKPDAVHSISLDITKFMEHIVKFVAERGGLKGVTLDRKLQLNGGMNPNNIKASDFANAVKAVGRTFKMNNMFGKGLLKTVSNYDDFIAQIKQRYIEKNEKAASNTKFNKAETPEAKQRAQDTKDLLINKSKEIARLLD